MLSVLLWIMHRGNIARLLNGSESKIGSALSVFFHPLNLRFRGMLAGKRGTCRLGALGAK